MKYEIIKSLNQLENDGFIRSLPVKVEINISLKELCDMYGPVKSELYSQLLNKLLSYLEHKGYIISGGWNGGLSVNYTLTKGDKNE